jgi:macrodomain Ter protein organizer (MatP/YcbG family)
MSSRVVVDRDFNTKTLDKGLKSVWKWEWLEKKVREELIDRFIRKIKIRGHAYCELCNKNINYAGRRYIFL